MTRSAREVYATLENESLWTVAEACHQALAKANLPHLIVGGVAVCLHGYQRNTVDLNLLVRRSDGPQIHFALEQVGFTWDAANAELHAPAGMSAPVQVQLLLSGDRAGSGSEVLLPEPDAADSAATIDGLPVLSLARLLEIKIACGEGNLRRTHKDFADVVELIAVNQLDGSFARHLHKTVRSTFRQLVKRARGDA